MKTHWRKTTNPNYLGAWDFQPDEERIVTIKECRIESVMNAEGKSETKNILYFKEPYKPMVLNNTNARVIQRMTKSAYMEDWVDTKISIHIEKVKAFGDVTDGIRISKQRPVQVLPELTPKHPNWDAAKTAIKSGSYTIESIRAKYVLSDANMKLLTSS